MQQSASLQSNPLPVAPGTTPEAVSEAADKISQQNLTDPAQLVAAFEQFGRLSDQLQQSYHELDQRAAELTRQLASAQNERLIQLAEKERLAHRLETLLNAMPAGVLLVDEEGTIKTANPAAERLLEQPLENKQWRRVYAHSVAQHTEHELHLNSGRILSVKTQPLDDKNGQQDQQGEIILLDDITEQRMLESLANRQNRLAAMGQMAAGLAHQLRTPLASAVLYASQLDQFAAAESGDNKQQHKAVNKVRTCLRYLEKLINDMLMYARGGEFAEQQFLLDELLVTFNTRIENRLRESQAQLTIISEFNDFQLTGSMDALVSVLINLAENAIEACGDEACELQLEVSRQADHLILAMRDNGPGLSIEEQAKIFQPFYTNRRNRKNASGADRGTGLGLAVAQSIVQAHHGDLLVRSQPGKGSSFHVCLPLSRGEQFLASGHKNSAGEDV